MRSGAWNLIRDRGNVSFRHYPREQQEVRNISKARNRELTNYRNKIIHEICSSEELVRLGAAVLLPMDTKGILPKKMELAQDILLTLSEAQVAD